MITGRRGKHVEQAEQAVLNLANVVCASLKSNEKNQQKHTLFFERENRMGYE